MPTTFRAFYSWQSDSNKSTNQEFIEQALEAAALTLSQSESRSNFKVYIDQATRDEAGSPNIPETILKKIAICDAFICDVTTVTPDSECKVPNANAVYELGYAVAMLGWGRVILVFNEAIGKFPEEMPFDFDRHRAWKYKALPATSKETKDALERAKKNLSHFFVDALGVIIDDNPKRPDWLTDVSTDEIKRNRDIVTLRLLLRDLPIDEIDHYVNDLPVKFAKSIFHFWEGYHANWTASLTHVYDEELRQLLGEIHNSWEETLAFPEHFSHEHHVYHQWKGNPFDKATKEAENSIFNSAQRMKDAISGLTKLISEKYLEIDLSESSRAAWYDYVKFSTETFSAKSKLKAVEERLEGSEDNGAEGASK